MRDAFGVEVDDTVEKAFSLRPVTDFVKGAASSLKMARSTPLSSAGRAGAAAPGQIRQAAGAVRQGAAAGTRVARAKMPSIPRPTSTQMKVGGAIGGTGLVAGGAGYALGGKKEY